MGPQTLVRGQAEGLVNWAAISTQVNMKQTDNDKTIKQTSNKQTTTDKQTTKSNKKQTTKSNQTNKQHTNKQTFAGQAELIVRSAAAASSGQDDDFEDDPVFNEILFAGESGSNVGALGRGHPGRSSSQFLAFLSSIHVGVFR